MIARQQGRELAAVAAEAGADLPGGSSLKAALDRQWDDPDQRGAALGQVLGTLEAVEDAELVRATLQSEGYVTSSSASPHGYFYAVQVVPEFAPNRVKLGWASDVQARLAAHRTAAPTAALVKSWPCRQRWEFTAIDSATRTGCKALLNEVFECDSLDALVQRVDAFFAIMPDVTKTAEIAAP